jgi:hypothetical protein
MKMNVRSIYDHDEGHYTSLKMGSYHKAKNEENLDGFYYEIDVIPIIKKCRKLSRNHNLSVDTLMKYHKKYDREALDAAMDDCEFCSFEEWLHIEHII